MTASTLSLQTPAHAEQAIDQAADTLRGGGLVVFPTETLYGVAALLTSEAAMTRLRQLKSRDGDEQAFTVHLPSPADARQYIDVEGQPLLRRLLRKTMPGPVTLIVPVSDDVIAAKSKALGLDPATARLIYHRGTVSLRCPDHPVAAALLAAVDGPVVAAGANRHGDPAPSDARTARKLIGDEVDLILDDGTTRYGKPSTIIRVDGGEATLIREGVIDQRYLDKLMKQLIVFVCSGNTCRSPMSEAIARDELARRTAVKPDSVQVVSAGVFAMAGAPMAPEAEVALKQMGVEPHAHESRPLTPTLALQADVIFCMTESHLAAVREIAPAAAYKAQLLDPTGAGVEDPIGAGADIYVECARSLRHMIRHRLDELGF